MGARIDTKNAEGLQAVDSACGDEKGSDIAKLLIKKEAIMENAITLTGQRLLYNACFYGWRYEIVEYLIERGADVHASDRDGIQALHAACTRKYNSAIAKVLIEHGADVNATTKRGRRPLHIACLNKAYETAKVLIEYGADVNGARDPDRPIHLACAQSGNFPLIELLLRTVANVNAKDEDGKMPLHVACATGDLEVVQLLLDQGADITAATEVHGRPIDIASIHGYEHIVNLLVAKGQTIDVTLLRAPKKMMAHSKGKDSDEIEDEERVQIEGAAQGNDISRIANTVDELKLSSAHGDYCNCYICETLRFRARYL